MNAFAQELSPTVSRQSRFRVIFFDDSADISERLVDTIQRSYGRQIDVRGARTVQGFCDELKRADPTNTLAIIDGFIAEGDKETYVMQCAYDCARRQGLADDRIIGMTGAKAQLPPNPPPIRIYDKPLGLHETRALIEKALATQAPYNSP